MFQGSGSAFENNCKNVCQDFAPRLHSVQSTSKIPATVRFPFWRSLCPDFRRKHCSCNLVCFCRLHAAWLQASPRGPTFEPTFPKQVHMQEHLQPMLRPKFAAAKSFCRILKHVLQRVSLGQPGPACCKFHAHVSLQLNLLPISRSSQKISNLTPLVCMRESRWSVYLLGTCWVTSCVIRVFHTLLAAWACA